MEFLIPIIMFLVVGAVSLTWIFFRSREKQMVIERGLDIEFIKEIFKKAKYPYALLKAGIIILFFGLGLGIGMLIHVNTGVEEWIPFLLFVGTGIGFIVAYYAGRKAEAADNLLKRKYLYAINFAINNKDNEVAPYIALAEIYDANIKYLDTIYNSLTPDIAKSKYGIELEAFIKQRKEEEECALFCEIGCSAAHAMHA